MEKMDKKMMWSIVAVVVVIAVIWIAVVMNKDAGNNNGTTGATPGSGQPTPTPTPAMTPPGSGQSSSNLSYNEALAKYGTNRVQISDACALTPNRASYKAGTVVMYDNRSAGGHTVTFAGVKHTIAGYGWTILSMTAAKYPSTVLVDCDKVQNAATITIEK